jgi:hypothetical protein
MEMNMFLMPMFMSEKSKALKHPKHKCKIDHEILNNEEELFLHFETKHKDDLK